jgi:hypothetical protein
MKNIAAKQMSTDADLRRQKNVKMYAQQEKQKRKKESDEDNGYDNEEHPSLSARDRNPSMR